MTETDAPTNFLRQARRSAQVPKSRSTVMSNCARYLPVLVLMTKTKRRAKTATMRMKMTRRTKRMVMVKIRLHQEKPAPHYGPKASSTLIATRLTPVILGLTFKNRPRGIKQRYQDAMACLVKHCKPPLFITNVYPCLSLSIAPRRLQL
ncbi:BQ5605_C001g00919 [Microbotryum silenes-dioicae]|uniref:BQ5605_C001g00919 protein n=1 Tax=Microbotryum silenes-dioicae TaxID=796604 RepID=A0A2X0M7X8_9BASI|nr:BQ5605_C001g00919 [Microbotryum silenes-dioicae]